MVQGMALPLESDLLRTFLVVAETANFTRASDRLGRTQSAVSLQIKRLEDAVGDQLFDRGPRGVTPTRRGRDLLPYARRVVELLDEAGAAMRSAPLDGPVRIGIPEEYGQTVLPRALAAFAERHPAVEVTVKCGYAARQIEALARDEIDMAVVFDWNTEPNGDVLCIDPTVWVACAVHRVHEKRPVPIAIYENSSWCRDFAMRSLEQHGIVYRVAYSSDTTGGLKLAVSSGLAIAALSRSNIPEGCRELTLEDGYPPVDSSRVVLRRNPSRSSPAIDGMAQTISEAFGPAGARVL